MIEKRIDTAKEKIEDFSRKKQQIEGNIKGKETEQETANMNKEEVELKIEETNRKIVKKG